MSAMFYFTRYAEVLSPVLYRAHGLGLISDFVGAHAFNINLVGIICLDITAS
jgi:hypothetical protein